MITEKYRIYRVLQAFFVVFMLFLGVFWEIREVLIVF